MRRELYVKKDTRSALAVIETLAKSRRVSVNGLLNQAICEAAEKWTGFGLKAELEDASARLLDNGTPPG